MGRENTQIIHPVRIFFAVLTAAVMVMIFMLSCEDSDDSSQRSGTVTEAAAELIVDGFDEMTRTQQLDILDTIERVLRKLAHFSEYTLLGACAAAAAGECGLRAPEKRHRAYCVLGLCSLYSCTDELHQLFVPGRSCEIRDVLIDSSGSLTGILITIGVGSIAGFVMKKRAAR
ncbi:MAG: VanZ family protein [Ruminococcus sp.]|nr:VanZ family protein [Ruminococcus sp.]